MGHEVPAVKNQIQLFVFWLLTAWSGVSLGATRDWTLLVYHAYDDPELGSALNRDLRSIARSRATLDSGVSVVIQSDPFPKGLPTLRRVLSKPVSTQESDGVFQVVANLGETKSGSAETLKDFLAWGISQYPAENYAVFLSGHGNAWESVMEDSDGVDSDRPSQAISIPELTQIFATLPKRINVAFFDACLMANAEFAVELEKHFDLIVGAESALPDFGISYMNSINVFVDSVKEQNKSLGSIGRELARRLWNHYQSASQRSEIRRDPDWKAFGASAFEPRVARQAMALLNQAMSDLSFDEQKKLRRLSKRLIPMEDDFVDLGHFGQSVFSLRSGSGPWDQWSNEWNEIFEVEKLQSRRGLNFHLLNWTSGSGLLGGMSLIKDSTDLLSGLSITWSESDYFKEKKSRKVYEELSATQEFPAYYDWIRSSRRSLED